MNGGLGRFLHVNAGLVGALLMLALVLLLWVTGFISFGSDSATERERAQRLANLEMKMTYVICTAVPPTTRNELRALRENCGPIDEEMRNLPRREG